ncbi:MAG: hypothetical protein RI988_3818 [Pseudomonadota bacterium]|jgi:hypothetical protein
MEFGFLWIGLAVVVGVAATSRGRSGFGWFFLAVVISPLLAGLLVLALGRRNQAPVGPTPETHVRCPDCRELVLRDAKRCKHCGITLIPQ